MTINFHHNSRGMGVMWWLCAVFLLLISITSCRREAPVRMFSEKEYHYEERLSALSSDSSAYWVGTETGVIWHVSGEKRQRFDTGLDRIYDVERDLRHPQRLWIASRNAGLQLWEMAGDTLIHRSTFNIPRKGNRYSPYDIDLTDSVIFIATSQGLYSMATNQAAARLRLLYPSAQSATATTGEPFLVNSLCHAGRWLFAATQNGVIALSMRSREITLRHQGSSFRQVGIYNGRLCCLSDNCLITEEADGSKAVTTTIPQSALAYYQVGATHYYITTSGVLLSDDQHRFVNTPLLHNIPSSAHHIVIPNDGTGFSVVLTEYAVWHIPHHLGVFNANDPVIAACSGEATSFYLNNRNELFRQQKGDTVAEKVYDFEKNEQPIEMRVVGDNLFYYNTNNQLCRLTTGKSYLINQLFAHPKVLCQPETRITTMAIQPGKQRILLGVQDYLLSISMQKGHVDTVPCMRDKYITSFTQPLGGGHLLLSTLNHGVFIGSGDRMKPVTGTAREVFINSVATHKGTPQHLILLTNHELQVVGGDSLRADGCSQLFAIGDSTLYTLPETGVHKYVLRGKKLIDKGLLFADIRFNSKATFVRDGVLYAGSDLGVLRLQPGKEGKATWIEFNGDAPNLHLLGLIVLGIIIIITIALAGYLRQRRIEQRQLQASKDDLHRRLVPLVAMKGQFSEAERESIDTICQQIDSIETTSRNSHAANEQLARLSGSIAKMNRDAALKMVNILNEQIERIKKFDVYDRPTMIESSLLARQTEEIEEIQQQCSRNDMWINHIEELTERVEKIRKSVDGALILPGLNDGIAPLTARIIDNMQRKPMSEVYKDYAHVKAEYENIFTPQGLSIIKTFVTRTLEELGSINTYPHMTAQLTAELCETEHDMEGKDRILLLRSLHIIHERVLQIRMMERLQELMQSYAEVHEQVVEENEERRIRKFNTQLFADIESATRDITDEISRKINDFFASFSVTDREVCNDIFHFTNANSQQVRVLTLLLALPKVKRTLLPGMLGIYGNLNPVVSRLYHSKIGDNKEALEAYCSHEKASIVHYILKLSE